MTIYYAHAGAAEVVATDREPLALECALRSAAASGLRSVQPWGSEPDQAPADAHGRTPAGRRAGAAPSGAPSHQARPAMGARPLNIWSYGRRARFVQLPGLLASARLTNYRSTYTCVGACRGFGLGGLESVWRATL